MSTKFNLPNIYVQEQIKYNELYLKGATRTSTGNPSWTSTSSSATYTVTDNTGENGLLTLIQTAIIEYLIIASDFNSKADLSVLANYLLISEVTDIATANKVLRLNGSSKLPASITGDADTIDSYHAGNSSGNVPISNGTVCANLNADKVDGYDAGSIGTWVGLGDTEIDVYATEISEAASGGHFIGIVFKVMNPGKYRITFEGKSSDINTITYRIYWLIPTIKSLIGEDAESVFSDWNYVAETSISGTDYTPLILNCGYDIPAPAFLAVTISHTGGTTGYMKNLSLKCIDTTKPAVGHIV